MNVSTMSAALRFPLSGRKTVSDLFEWLSFFGEILNLASFNFVDYIRSLRTNSQQRSFPRKFIVVGSVLHFYPSIGKDKGNIEDTQVFVIENFTLLNSDVFKVRVVLRENLVTSLKSLQVGDIICLIAPNFCMTPDGLTVGASQETILVHVKAAGFESMDYKSEVPQDIAEDSSHSQRMASQSDDKAKLHVLETRNKIYTKKASKDEDEQRLGNYCSAENDSENNFIDMLKKVRSWLYNSTNSLLSSDSSTGSIHSEQDVDFLDSASELHSRLKTCSFPGFDISASNFLLALHSKYTTGGDTQFIEDFYKTPEEVTCQKARLSGFVIGVDPELISPMSILVGECKSRCGKVFSFPLLFQVASKYELDFCPHCDFSGHITCPVCSTKDAAVPLCIRFSFHLHLLCGTSEVEVLIENKEAEYFLDCTIADYLNDPEVQVESLVNLYKLVSHKRITSESTAVVLNIILKKVSATQVYLYGTKLYECRFQQLGNNM